MSGCVAILFGILFFSTPLLRCSVAVDDGGGAAAVAVAAFSLFLCGKFNDVHESFVVVFLFAVHSFHVVSCTRIFLDSPPFENYKHLSIHQSNHHYLPSLSFSQHSSCKLFGKLFYCLYFVCLGVCPLCASKKKTEIVGRVHRTGYFS